jgi:hypothetical protein
MCPPAMTKLLWMNIRLWKYLKYSINSKKKAKILQNTYRKEEKGEKNIILFAIF